jgi:hypothetical protein
MGKAYNMAGTDVEKLALLKQLSATDYVTATRYELPERFTIVCADGAVKERVTLLNAVSDPGAQLFESVFRNIEKGLPVIPDFSAGEGEGIPQKIPQDPLCVTTVLYEDDGGNIRPIITDEDRAFVREHQRMLFE